MPQEDHLKKQIDRLGLVLGRLLANLLSLKDKEQQEQAIQKTNQVVREEFAFDLYELLQLPTDELLPTLATKRGVNSQSLENLAHILLWLADNKVDTNKKALYEKSLALYEHLEKTESVYSLERHWKIERLRKEVGE